MVLVILGHSDNRTICITLYNSTPNGSMILRLDTLNLIEEKVGNRFELVGTRKDFLNKTPLAQILRPN